MKHAKLARISSRLRGGLFACLLASVTSASAAELTSLATKASAVYHLGEAISIQVKVGGEKASEVTSTTFEVKVAGAKLVHSGTLSFTDQATVLDLPPSVLPTESSTLLITFQAKDPITQKNLRSTAGVAIDPSGIKPSVPKPADFDAFWDAKVASLAALPLNPTITPVPFPPATRPSDPGDTVIYEKITLDNINASKVYGQLARPSKPGKYPAVLQVQYAGVYPLDKDWVVGRARGGWLALNIIAHDVPFDLPATEFKKLNDTTLKDYVAIGQKSRETSYFLRMYLSCHRAVEYLTTRPDWDGKVLVVTGGSQGGLQSIVAAALHPKVTAIMAAVPAGCDTNAQTAGRAFGWPYWQGRAKGDDAAAIMNTSMYFDAVNFAPRVKVPALIGMGLIDLTCPATGVFSMINQLAGPVETVIMPIGEHNKGHAEYAPRLKAWTEALRTGQPPPLPDSPTLPVP